MKKTIFKILILTATCFLCELRIVKSQNIISNNDFELYSTLPVNQGEIAKAIGWKDVIQSSDYMNTTYVCWSPEIGGAYSGNGFAGFATYGDFTGSAEAIGQDISSSPIIANTNYAISLYAKKTSGGIYNQSCGGITLYGFTSPPPLGSISNHASNLPGATLLWTSSLVSDSIWQYYNGCFQSSLVFNYVVITLEEIPGCGQYVFIDSINIKPSSFNLGNDTTLCQGQTISLNAGPANTYLWSDSSTASTINVSSSGAYWVQVSNGQCSFTDSINITFNSAPTVNLGSDTTLCQGQTITLYADSATSYLWSDSSTASAINVSTSGTYWAQVSSGQCSNRDSINIIFNSAPTVNLGNDTTLCQGQTLTLNVDSATTYLWSNSSTDSTINVSTPGTYWAQVSNGQCSNIDSINIIFNTIPTVNLGNDMTLCQGQTLTLDAGSATLYLWSDSSTDSTINVSSSGTYWAEISNGQCSNSDSININFISPPTINLGNDTTLCPGQTLTLNAGSANSYLWSDSSTTSTINVSTSGTYWVQVNSEQCSNTDSINIIFNLAPIVNLGNDTTVCQGQTLTLNAGSATSYLWSDNSTDSTINVSTLGTYWVEVSNGQCSERDSLSINTTNCEIEIELPNVFTPNNDGLNDNFIPIKYIGITKATLRIFSRWGVELFYTEDLLHGWNGFYNGNICSDGTYYWIVQYTTLTNKSEELKGFLKLIE